MHAVILAGGFATGLWPVTKTKAKPLLPVGTKTIIDHIYEKLMALNLPIVVATNRLFQKDFEVWVADKDIELIVEESTREEEKLGAVRALAEVAEIVNDEMLVVAGDNIFSFGLNEFLRLYMEKDAPVVALYDVGDFELVKRYGVAEFEGGRLLGVHEKPDRPKSTIAAIGVYAFPRHAMRMLSEYVEFVESGMKSGVESGIESKSGKKSKESNVEFNQKYDSLGDFLNWLCSRTNVYCHLFTGNWYDVGSPDSYIEALKVYMDSYIASNAQIKGIAKVIPPVVIEDGSKVKGRSIIGPFAYIGRNCEIADSDLGESVVFDGVVLRGTRVWRSIIDERCEVRNLELKNSVIGGHAKIQGGI